MATTSRANCAVEECEGGGGGQKPRKENVVVQRGRSR